MEIKTSNEEIRYGITKYLDEEKKLDAELHECEARRMHMESCRDFKKIQNLKRRFYINNEEANNRNETLLMDLEISRARWRTLTSFTPTDQELAERIVSYRRFLLNM